MLIFLRRFLYYVLKVTLNKNKASKFYLKQYMRPESVCSEIVESKHSERVWTMWLQDDIPPIVKVCIKTIKDFYPNLVVITENNIEEYINIPTYIKEKFEKKIISAPHFSDYVRCALLEKYGGLWIDASCYMSSRVPEFITNQEFFILTEPSMKAVSNFFIYSNSNHYLISVMKIFLEDYWRAENSAINYFFFHHFFILICEQNAQCRKLFQNMTPFINSQIRYFVDHPNLEYSPELWNYLLKSSFMYKINRKDKVAMQNKKGIYQYILNINS